jgi:hypothetical protein
VQQYAVSSSDVQDSDIQAGSRSRIVKPLKLAYGGNTDMNVCKFKSAFREQEWDFLCLR